jgi:CubicO group peptidase (beta-lactamase class C family)
VLLGLVIEEVSGQPYVDFVQQRVFDRARMSSSGFLRLDEAHPNVAIGYLPRPSPDAPWRSNIYRIPVIGGADGGAFSTTGDLDRFLHRIADGTLLRGMQDVVLARHADAGGGFHLGYGFIHYPDGRYGHGGGDPGVDVLLQRFPDDDVNLIVLCNMEGVAGDVRTAVLEAWRGPAAEASSRPLSDAGE